MHWLKTERLLITLITLSVLLPALQHFSLNRVYVIDHSIVDEVSLIDDREVGGKSVASVSYNKSSSILNCQISKKAYQWPFCEMVFRLREDYQSVDFSQFEFMRVYVKAVSEKGVPAVKIYLRNSNPAYTVPGDVLSFKINEIQFYPEDHPYPLDLPLRSFVVAQWWQDEMKLPPSLAFPELDSIVQIDIVTGASREEGLHTIEVAPIELHGKWVSRAEVLAAIVLMWLAYSFYLLYQNIREARRETERANITKKVLQDINSTLSLEKVELEVQASRDHLTGAYNRAGLRQFLIQLYSSFQRHGNTFSMVFMDIDHFKNVNDKHGHDIGDQVLEQFAALIVRETRSDDILGRWGGEEFILLCPNTNLSSIKVLAEKLRHSIEEDSWPNDLNITSSFGVAEIRQQEDVSQLIKRADSALYQAKSAGRNQVVESL